MNDRAGASAPRADLVRAARACLGPVGAFLPHSFAGPVSVRAQIDAVRRLEAAGHGAVWVNEVPGKDALVQLAVLLAATERMVLGTGIANIWVRPAQTARGAAAQLAQAYPGRLVLSLGVGNTHQAAGIGVTLDSPLTAMRSYVARMDTTEPGELPAPDADYPRILGAIGPKMLALAAEVADGAMPAGGSPQATAAARGILGPDKLLVVLVDVSDTAGDPAAAASALQAHRDAGADHAVALLPIGIDFAAGVDLLVRLGAVAGATS